MSEIEIYTKGYCGYCFAAKRLLTKKSLEFKEIAIDRDLALQAEMIQRSGQRTVPQIFINGRSVGGYTEISQLDRSGQLDELLSAL